MTEQSVPFVILEHDHPYLHWDFMFEQGDSLRSWRLLHEPVLDRWIPAEQLPPHRKYYLDYEGPVSGNRGHVTRWDFGTCLIGEDLKEKITLTLIGSRWRVQLVLEQISTDNEEWKAWLSPLDGSFNG